jgi:hypothetical protein
MDKLLKYFPLVKIDEAAHMVWGVVTSEKPDSDDEICDYPFTKGAIQKWSDDTFAKTTNAGQDPSLGNMRVMHQLEIGGKAIKITFDDDAKKIWVGSEPADDDVWHLLKGGFLTAHSIGGGYAWKRKEGEYIRFGPTITEISYVDKGANPDASFSYVKADGSIEMRKFAQPGDREKNLIHKLHTPMVTVPLEELRAELGTGLAKIRAVIDDFVAQTSAVNGAHTMNPEQIKKAAAALGMSEEDFKKHFVSADALEKAKGGIAALHGHLEKAMEDHDAMAKAHAALGSMHEKNSAHLGKCMKACKAVMGSDDKESEKAIKALLADLVKAEPKPEPAPAPAPAPGTPEVFTKADFAAAVQKLKEDSDAAIAKAVKDALDKVPDNPRAALFSVTRENDIKKAAEVNTADPLPV